MITIYTPPTDMTIPSFNSKTWKEDETKFIDELRAFCVMYGKGEYRGKIAKFTVADGHAVYMVISTKPCKLIHLPIGDGWEYQYINRLKAADIIANIKTYEKLEKIFS